MSQLTPKWRLSRFSFLQIGIVSLAVITALIHLYFGIHTGSMMAGGPPAGSPPAGGPPAGASGGASIMSMLPVSLPVLFDLNFIGYIVLTISLYLPALHRFQNITRWLLIGYTAITIVLWYLMEGSHADVTGYIDKLIEVALIALLLFEGWMSRRETA